MFVQRTVLSCIFSVLLTISAYHFFLSVFVNPRRTRYLYFSISTAGGSIFCLFALFLTLPFNEEIMLLYHRLRMLGLMVCLSAWVYCIYEIYLREALFRNCFSLSPSRLQ